jgi:hypothetical protein
VVHVSVARRRDERGVVAVLVAVFASVLLVLAGLVADLGAARDVKLQAQNAADAAALAGANALYAAGGQPDIAAATAAVTSYARSNFGVGAAAWAACTDPDALPATSGIPCISYDSQTEPTVVRVVIPPRDVDTPLGSLVGISRVAVDGVAEASVHPGGRADCGLCVVGDGDHDIQNGDIQVDGASVFFNGSLVANPQGQVTVTGDGSSIRVQGTVSNKGTVDPPPLTGQPPVADPLAFLTLPPSYAGLQPRTGDACTNGPGFYYGTFGLSSCTLHPGLYVLAGSSVDDYAGNTNVVANGVTFYFTCARPDRSPRPCAAGEAGAGILLTGKASLTINAPLSGPTQGIAMMSDRNNTATFGFRGNGGASSGTIYARSGTLDYRGNGNGVALDSLIVVGDLTFSGNNAALSSTYTQEKNAGLPPAAPHLSR